MSRFLTPFVVSAVTLLAAQTLAPVVSADVRVGVASAFKGTYTTCPKRIRIKKRGWSHNRYRVAVTTSSEETVPAGIAVSYDSLDAGDASSGTVTASDPDSAAYVTSASFGMVFPEDGSEGSVTLRLAPVGEYGSALSEAVEVTVPVDAGGYGEAFIEDTDLADGISFGVVLFDARIADPRADGETAVLEVEVDLDAWSGEGLSTVEVEVVESSFEVIDSSVETDIDAVDAAWKLDFEDETLADDRLQLTVSTLDASGEVEEDIGFAMRNLWLEDGLAGPLLRASVKETSAEDRYAVVAWALLSDASSDTAGLSAAVRDIDGNDVADVDLRVKDAVRTFGVGGLTFQDDPADFTYSVWATPLDADGLPLSDGQGFELVVTDASSDLQIVEHGGDGGDDLSLHKGYLELRDDGTTIAALSFDGLGAFDVASVALDFEEPFEGPEPDELSVTLSPTGTFVKSRRAFTAEGLTDPNLQVTVSVTSDLESENEEVDFWTTAGVAGGGRGTKGCCRWTPGSLIPTSGLQ